MDSQWLTDSTNFRIYLGTFDEADGGIYVECSGDTVYVNEVNKSNEPGSRKDSVTIYLISELRKKQNINDN